jgi:hypothetical protein
MCEILVSHVNDPEQTQLRDLGDSIERWERIRSGMISTYVEMKSPRLGPSKVPVRKGRLRLGTEPLGVVIFVFGL